MQLDLLTVIATRAKAKYDADFAWVAIYPDGSWGLNIIRRMGDDDESISTGDTLDELPALLSSLKNFTESYPKES